MVFPDVTFHGCFFSNRRENTLLSIVRRLSCNTVSYPYGACFVFRHPSIFLLLFLSLSVYSPVFCYSVFCHVASPSPSLHPPLPLPFVPLSASSCCLLTSFTLTAASLITIEGWSQLSRFSLFLLDSYLPLGAG